ncbi:hypothetical protein Tco_0273969 [Tanacetum coccineum]
MITVPSTSPISTAFFSNNMVPDFQENSDNKADERTNEEYLRDLEIKFHERAPLASSKQNPFIPDSMDYDHEMIPKSKDWVERFNPDSKLPNFNTKRILTPESQTVNEHLKLTEACTDLKSSKESGSEPLTPVTSLKNLQGASPSSKVMPLIYQDHSPRERPGLGTMKHTKPETQESSSKSVT